MLTYINNETAWFLLQQKLSNLWPCFTLHFIEVRSRALIHAVHMLILQLGSLIVHARKDQRQLVMLIFGTLFRYAECLMQKLDNNQKMDFYDFYYLDRTIP